MHRTQIILTVIIIASSLSYATIINVPGDYLTIQEGLNAATQGDTVLVQPGTYQETITWPGVNGIKLFSAGDSSNTIIFGSSFNSVIRFESNGNVDTTTVLKGFKITNGESIPGGGGIYLNQSSPIIEECVVMGNKGLGGGGISCSGGRPIITSCTVCRNEGTTLSGGILSFDSGLIIDSCNIVENQGGGIFCSGGQPVIKNSVISSNYTYWQGSGIYLAYESNAIIENCTVVGNQGILGGGIVCSSSELIMRGVLIECNTTRYYGGGITCHGSSPSIEHCTIVGNHAENSDGDGIFTNDHSWPNISFCNIFQNGMGVYNDDTTQVLNCPYNWWGDITGPYHPYLNPNGLGDSVNIYVNPLQYLTEPDSLAPPSPVEIWDLVVPEGFKLSQNYPNPFNPVTSIPFELPVMGKVSLKVYNVLGQEVGVVVDGEVMEMGRHMVRFDGGDLASGVYFYQLVAGEYVEVKKMVLMK